VSWFKPLLDAALVAAFCPSPDNLLFARSRCLARRWLGFKPMVATVTKFEASRIELGQIGRKKSRRSDLSRRIGPIPGREALFARVV
jgi:hypothetical protein